MLTRERTDVVRSRARHRCHRSRTDRAQIVRRTRVDASRPAAQRRFELFNLLRERRGSERTTRA